MRYLRTSIFSPKTTKAAPGFPRRLSFARLCEKKNRLGTGLLIARELGFAGGGRITECARIESDDWARNAPRP